MADPPRISDAEWLVMRVLWDAGEPLPAAEVAAALHSDTRWNPQTVKTLLARLEKKGAVDHAENGRAFRYFAAVSERDCIRAESRSFLDRVFGGSVRPMIAHLLEEGALSADEVAALRRLLDERDAS
jgi:BlaI family penicillinase repressor